MTTPPLRHTDQVSRGDWIRDRLTDWSTITGIIPAGFEAYARVLHPDEAVLVRWEDGNPIAVESSILRWREVAERCGTVWHPLMQWAGITAGHTDPGHGEDGWQLGEPMLGQLPLNALAAIAGVLSAHTETPDAVTAGLWEGFGWIDGGSAVSRFISIPEGTGRRERKRMLRAARTPEPPGLPPEVLTGARLDLPGRRYLLFEGDVRGFEDAHWLPDNWGPAAAFWKQTPNLLWPEDRAWFLASEIDFDSTLIGGSRALIDAIVACPEIEAVELPANASLTWDADTLNPRPVRPY